MNQEIETQIKQTANNLKNLKHLVDHVLNDHMKTEYEKLALLELDLGNAVGSIMDLRRKIKIHLKKLKQGVL